MAEIWVAERVEHKDSVGIGVSVVVAFVEDQFEYVKLVADLGGGGR